ncbi:hypothetical protein AmDm5_1647 [Acetobacter malorum]|nr:hypothetical protein AmDm5_1647 [Acetobacter malorum]
MAYVFRLKEKKVFNFSCQMAAMPQNERGKFKKRNKMYIAVRKIIAHDIVN